MTPHAYAAAMTMKATIAPTLMDANQNSNSPKVRDESKFTAVSSTSNASPICHTGSGNHSCRIFAPAIASIATTTTQKYQYSQPQTKPAQCPSPSRAYSVKDPTPGAA